MCTLKCTHPKPRAENALSPLRQICIRKRKSFSLCSLVTGGTAKEAAGRQAGWMAGWLASWQQQPASKQHANARAGVWAFDALCDADFCVQSRKEDFVEDELLHCFHCAEAHRIA